MALPRSTLEIQVPSDPLERVIGQDEAVKIARIAAKQRRHLLLVGPPGTGKSMIAQAIARLLPPPRQEVSVLHNPENPQRPILEIRDASEIRMEMERRRELGKLVDVCKVPVSVAEKLGYRCRRCGRVSSPLSAFCPTCGADKYINKESPFDDLLPSALRESKEERVLTTRIGMDGKEELVAYERAGPKIRVLNERELRELESIERRRPRKVLLPLNRNTFVQATGASETELLGDVQHDPYGGHPEAGIPAYLRVIPGAVHEAHEGVLFIDEISTLGELQRYILTAMEEKKFPITGRNATSTGASVRVDGVPCDFILVAALNTNDLSLVLPPLRSRILGNGYEVLLKTTMEDNEANRMKLVQFIAQEIKKDGKIPHADHSAIKAIIDEARERAKSIDDASSALTLRLRDLSGLIKLAGDLAVLDGSEFITAKHVEEAKEKARTAEEQIASLYSSWWKAGMSDYGVKKPKKAGSEVV